MRNSWGIYFPSFILNQLVYTEYYNQVPKGWRKKLSAMVRETLEQNHSLRHAKLCAPGEKDDGCQSINKFDASRPLCT